MVERESAPSCICCGFVHPSNYFIKRNDRGEFPVVRCPSCGCSFVWPRPDASVICGQYSHESYSNLTLEQAIKSDLRYYPNSSHDSGRILDSCEELSRGKRLLDVGAGYGMFSRTALDRGFEVSACEPNPNARKVFQQLNGSEPDEDMFDGEYAYGHKGSFDVVLLTQVLEHVLSPEEVVRNIDMVLGPEGIAAVAVPHFGSALSRLQGKKDMFISPPEHLNFFSEEGLISLFTRNNFKTEIVETVSKVPRGRIEDALRVPVISKLGWMGLYGFLRIFDFFDMGMVINAYFRKG